MQQGEGGGKTWKMCEKWFLENPFTEYGCDRNLIT